PLSLHDALPIFLKREGYISDFRLEEGEQEKDKAIVIALKYGNDRSAAFRGMRRVSTPGRRVYARHNEIPRVVSGLGVSIISTSQGLMTDQEARHKRVGGEILCEVW